MLFMRKDKLRNHAASLFRVVIVLLFFSRCGSNDDVSPSGNPTNTNLTATTKVVDANNNEYSIGFDHATSINQNPTIIKKDATGKQIWKVTYETTPVDGRGNLIALDSDNIPWAVFSVDGGSTDAGFINKKQIASGAFSNVYMNGYGSGGGAKVAVFAKIDPANGNILKGTFIIAKLTSGNTNTLNITKMGFKNGNVAFEISSAAWPPGKGKSYIRFPNIDDSNRTNGSFIIYYEMKSDLSEIVEAALL